MRRAFAAFVILAPTICLGALPFTPAYGADVGRPHTCNVFRNAGAGVEGITTVKFHITTEGQVSGLEMVSPSGNREQDAAAMECAQAWRYKPAIRDGAPVEVPWLVDIAWNPTVPPDLTRQLRDCGEALRGKLNTFAPTSDATQFAITYEGFKVSNVIVTHSSGDASLDKAAVACLMSPLERIETVVVNSSLNLLARGNFPGRIVWKDADR